MPSAASAGWTSRCWTSAPSPEVDRYRNKVQFPVGLDKNGNPCIGFYAGRTHRIVPCPDCKLQPGVLNDIGNALCRFFAENGIQPYNEETGRGLVRHIFLRRARTADRSWCVWCAPARTSPHRCAVHPSAGAVCGHCHHPAQCQQQKAPT